MAGNVRSSSHEAEQSRGRSREEERIKERDHILILCQVRRN